MTLAARRFPTKIIRLRQAPGRFNQYGEFEAGPTFETLLSANVQPVSLADSDITGGAQLIERLKVFVPYAPEIVSHEPNLMRWGMDLLRWGADRLTFGQRAIYGTQGPSLAAAFEDKGADHVRYLGKIYVVEESETWGDFVRAVLLRAS